MFVFGPKLNFLIGLYEGHPSVRLSILFLIAVGKKLESSWVSYKILKSEICSAYLGLFTKPGGLSLQVRAHINCTSSDNGIILQEISKQREVVQIPKITYNVNIHFCT